MIGPSGSGKSTLLRGQPPPGAAAGRPGARAARRGRGGGRAHLAR
ncbi:MAG TPA: hypothetical protein VHY31_15865 [Streptosporangiaceae bacterium]|nr:hypothetical protein [Streptosporangiaceae bacterium]